MVLSVTIEGFAGPVDLISRASRVFNDASDELLEGVGFFSLTDDGANPFDTQAPWDSWFTVRIGIKKPVSGNWEITMYPVYGSPSDSTSTTGKNQPYYSRMTITAEFSDGTDVLIDSVAAAEVIGNGQGIPPTVVEWNPTTEVVVSSVEGHTLAFIDTVRVEFDPNATGFDTPGEFALRYDHAVGEGRETFYVLACYGGTWLNADGTFLRGDILDKGQSKGFTFAERHPHIEWEDHLGGATNYPIEHLVIEAGNKQPGDFREWDNTWKEISYEQRLDSGIGPLCLNIVSRGATYLRDFGMAWLVKALGARMLTQYPSPITPHARNSNRYKYGDYTMRGNGRILWATVSIWRALGLLKSVRTSDTELNTLHLALQVRVLEIVNELKDDFVNGEWRSWQRDETYGYGLPYWEAGHYWQGLLLYQEAVTEFIAPDPVIHTMMSTIASEIFANTLLWPASGTHPRGGGSYSGSSGYFVEYLKFSSANAHQSTPTTGIAPAACTALYTWMQANGIDLGAKLTAINAQSSYANQHDEWQYGDPPSGGKQHHASVTFAVAATLAATAHRHLGASVQLDTVGTLVASGNLVTQGGSTPGDVESTYSPDLGSGGQMVAIVSIGLYDAGSSTGTTIDVVSSSAADLTTDVKQIGSSGLITAAQMASIDDASRLGGTPLVIRINPDHWSAIDVTSFDASYFGLRFTHAGASPTTMTHRVSFVLDSQSHPRIGHHTSGLRVL